ncbi:MAG: ATP-dependent DNA helicase RecG [Rhodocyclaceae bacterium]|nr:ATP-dependent DNA helicase RecG [Rhodocyclaceae bacterium]
MEKLLAKLGLRTDADFILHVPLRYEDETCITTIRHASFGDAAQFEAIVVSCELSQPPHRQLLCRMRDDTGFLLLRFLKFYPSQQKAFTTGARLRFFGEPREGFYGTEIIHPRCRVIAEDAPLPTWLTPVYPTTAGLSQTVLRGSIEQALNRADLTETLPEGLRQKLKLATFEMSVRFLHHLPPNITDPRQHPAWRRLAFDELLAQQLSLRRASADRHRQQAPALAGTQALTDRLLASLPFQLTEAQQRVWREIATDLARTTPMQRLLQGDVGSGKTIVAALAMLQTVESGYQAALMVPTEILAEQHYRKLVAWFVPLGLEVAWLSGSLGKKARIAAKEAIATGRAMLVVGTHALIEAEVTFSRLGLSIVDEQHRFGVVQRLALKQISIHQLTMSATPIPRTLAMSYYADLTVSVIDELPPGRTPVLTKLVTENRRDEVIHRVRCACHAGRQAYWVCPLIAESEVLQLKTAQETFERLTAELPEISIGLVHGRLKAAEKAAVMNAFVRGEVQLLVATTVIEVGVDVANASLMVIEHAERFGLAQLHQLRGRVGRGTEESACILLYASPLGAIARQRLKIIYENTDGFEVARLDLQLRGPGEFIGARQSGIPLLRFADLDDSLLIEQARTAADELLAKYPEQVKAHLNRWLGGREGLLSC